MTMNPIIVGGCNIPVTNNIDDNLNEILQAIDWAVDNNVQLMVTPECALSGYLWAPGHPFYDQDPKISKLANSLVEIEKYLKDKKVDLILGTAWYDKDGRWVNTQRYIFNGVMIYEYCKNILTDNEFIYYSPKILPKIINYNGRNISGIICNDFWSNPVLYQGESAYILKYLMDCKTDIVFVSAFVPKEPGPENSFYHWHRGQIANMTLYCEFNTVVSDSSTNLDGSVYSGPEVCPVGIWKKDGTYFTDNKYFCTILN